MKTWTLAAGAAALAAFTLTQTIDVADARTRHRGGMAKSGMNNTGGRNASPSAAGGNAARPAQPGAQGSGGGGSGGAGAQ